MKTRSQSSKAGDRDHVLRAALLFLWRWRRRLFGSRAAGGFVEVQVLLGAISSTCGCPTRTEAHRRRLRVSWPPESRRLRSVACFVF